MDNKKYLDKVIGSLVRGTKIDYGKEEIQFPFSPSSPHFLPLIPLLFSSSPLSSFSKYCIDVYGLTDKEIEYVWKEYKSIILDKI